MLAGHVAEINIRDAAATDAGGSGISANSAESVDPSTVPSCLRIRVRNTVTRASQTAARREAESSSNPGASGASATNVANTVSGAGTVAR